nr:hypothetical protein BaRGS_032884 [Batillaria attramentaria]
MIWAENSLGLHSPILRMAFEALKDDANGTSGSLERIRHSSDDHVQKMDVGLNTSWSFPTSGLERGTRYYVTVRAVNGAGLMTTAFSDGVTVDVTPPVTGVVFAADRYTHRPAQTSTTTLSASWHGFQDAHSGVTSYYVTLNDVTANSTSLMPFRRVGTKTEYTLSGLTLEHNHR